MLSTYGNSKLGRTIHSFSLPVLTTCPGATGWCKTHCYANRQRFKYWDVRSYKPNLGQSTDSRYFIQQMTEDLKSFTGPAVRIHVSGDFYGIRYIQSWIRIVQAHSHIKFFGFTRSWAIPKLLPWLESLRGLPNMYLFASVDHTMPAPPKGWRRAWVKEGDKRAQRQLREKKAINCVYQTHGKTCDKCKWCFSNSRKNIVFKTH